MPSEDEKILSVPAMFCSIANVATNGENVRLTFGEAMNRDTIFWHCAAAMSKQDALQLAQAIMLNCGDKANA